MKSRSEPGVALHKILDGQCLQCEAHIENSWWQRFRCRSERTPFTGDRYPASIAKDEFFQRLAGMAAGTRKTRQPFDVNFIVATSAVHQNRSASQLLEMVALHDSANAGGCEENIA